MNTARVAAETPGISVANESALMEEIGKLDAEKAAVKLAQKVGPLLAELDPRKLREGN